MVEKEMSFLIKIQQIIKPFLQKKAINKPSLSCLTSTLGPVDKEHLENTDSPKALKLFIERCQAIKAPSVIELGTKRSIVERTTKHDEWIPHALEYIGTDIELGIDVDVVADVHRLSKVFGEERFDIIISCSTFEHFKYPHLAALEIMKTLKKGGVIFIQTHQTFPIHAYPHDYFRFSREALSGLFGTKMGFKVLATDYEFPAFIHSDRDQYMHKHPSFLNVNLYGEKTEKTPEDYIYELDIV